MVTKPTGTQQLSYKYDVDGTRVSSTVNGQETRFLIDANRPYAQVLQEYTPTGNIQVSYVYGNSLVSQERNGISSFYNYDGHSGVRLLTDTTGNATDSYTYDAYGNILQTTGTTTNSYLYRGEQFDPNLKLQYLRSRYYNPNLGRFNRADSFEGVQEMPLSRNQYIYGHSNPVGSIPCWK